MVSGRNDQAFLSWEQFTVYDITPMDEGRTIALIEKLDFNVELKARFLETAVPKLFSNKDRSFIQTPLLAVLMLLTYETYADVPDKMHVFYANAFETLIREHDVTKAQFRRPLISGIPEEDFKRLFAAFCAVTYSKRKFEFTYDEIERFLTASLKSASITASVRKVIQDLTLSICVMQYESLEYSFVHRSFQEYFTAVFLRDSPFKIVKGFLESGFHPARENVIPMLMGMDRDRVETEWCLPALREIAEFIKGKNEQERILNVLRKWWIIISFNVRNGEVRGLGPPQSDLYKKFAILETMYPTAEYPVWWIDSFSKQGARCQAALDLARKGGLELIKDAKKAKKGVSWEEDYSSMEVKVGIEEIDIAKARATGLYEAATYFLSHLDAVTEAVNSRVASRDGFSSDLFTA